MRIMFEFIKKIILFGIFLWALNAVFFYFHFKDIYYYPKFDLYIYVDGGIVGNRTVILGQNLDHMNTILRFDSRYRLDFYIAKSNDHYYIYWPEDTTSWHYTSVQSYNPNILSYELKKVPYLPLLQECKLDSMNFSLVTFHHQTPEDWIETFELWTDTLHWGSHGQLKIGNDIRLSVFESTGKYSMNSDALTIVNHEFFSFVKLFFKALDGKSICFILTLFLLVIVYRLCSFIEKRYLER